MDMLNQTPAGKTAIGSLLTDTPPADTPAPYNVAFSGANDGTGPSNASKNMAWVYNMIALEIVNTIKRAGLTPNIQNWAQLGLAVKRMIDDAVAALPALTPVQYADEGAALGTPGTVDTIDFVGGDIAAVRVGNKLTVSVPGNAQATQQTTLTATGTVDLTKDLTNIDTSAGAFSVILPLASTMKKKYQVISWIAGTNAPTLTCTGADTIDGAASTTIYYDTPSPGAYATFKLMAVANGWRIV